MSGGKKLLATASLALPAAALAWALSEARWPQLRFRELAVLPAGSEPLRVLHLADLHLTPCRDWMVDFIAECMRLNPDFVVSTGDNFSDSAALEIIQEAYAPTLKLPGAFVFGSNDYYSPRPKLPLHYLLRGSKKPRKNRDLPTNMLREYLGKSWIDLNNHGAIQEVKGLKLALIGVDDPHIRVDRIPQTPTGWEDAQLRIGLTHAPYSRVLDSYAKLGTDLVFAGHTHGGQVCLPGVGALVTNCDLPTQLVAGTYRWPNQAAAHLTQLPINGDERMWVQVSRGLGTNKFTPFRFYCRPEATMLVLTARAKYREN